MELKEEYWTFNHIWEGAILASIAHAIMVSVYPELVHEHSWDGLNYSIQDSQGGRATISFREDYCFGGFSCNRVKYVENLDEYMKDLPQEILVLAQQEALQYLLQEVDGSTMPKITTAFWGNTDKLYTMDSRESFYINGGYLLKNIVTESELAIEAWEEYYEMNEEQLELLRILFHKKVAEPQKRLLLSKQEISMIGATEDSLEECRTSFAEIGMSFEV